jgi:hypothetical protein
MSLLFRLYIFGLFPLLMAKTINPDGKETSVLLENINNNGKNYKYYELDKTGLEYSHIGEFFEDDSVRIKFYIREIIAEDKKQKQSFKIDLSLNDRTKELYYKNKWNSKHSLKNRPGWSVTEPGIWFIDIMYSEIKTLSIDRIPKSREKLIIRAVVEKINRQKLIPRIIETLNVESKYKIDTKSEKNGSLLSRSWYKLSRRPGELQFEVIGPTSIRIFSRIANPSHNSKNNDYSLFIKENGLDMGTFYFSTELSSLSNLKNTGEKVSKWRTCWINVPKGKHYYTIRRGVFPSKEFEFEANLQDDIYNSEDPIYIRVKRYDQR